MPRVQPIAVVNRWLPLAAATFCFVFGLATIANIHPSGDGLWYWYAALTRGGNGLGEGVRLYSDLHFNLQPLFVLLTSAGQRVFGMGWIAGKALAVLQLLLYIVLLYRVQRRVDWKPWERAALLLAVFAVMIAMTFFRFDDYHITTNLLEMLSILLLLRAQEREYTAARALVLALMLGVVAGLSTANRLNDGASLLAACAVAFVFSVRRGRLGGLVAMVMAYTVALLGTVKLTGDTLTAWANESILRAAKIKGGTGNILLVPVQLPWKAITLSRILPADSVGVVLFAFLVGVALPLGVLATGKELQRRWPVWVAAGFVVIATWPVFEQYCRQGAYLVPLCHLAIVPFYGVAGWVVLRLWLVVRHRPPADWRQQETLLLLPFLQLMAAAATAGGTMPMGPPAIATALLLLPIALPGRIPEGWGRRLMVTVVCLVALVGYLPKWVQPYAWHYYADGHMFHGRVVYRHPTLGPMYVERTQLALMEPMCATIRREGSAGELLSLPYPYPNWFCGIAPWHGYVQTWFDTSGEDTIARLDAELETAPPKWIVYQRLLPVMTVHEQAFRGGKPLPHRKLDALIVGKIASGAWKVEQVGTLNGGDWFLIRTR